MRGSCTIRATLRGIAPALLLAVGLVPMGEAQSTTQSERERRRAALEARETAERRIEADMVTMNNLVEALSKNLGQMHYLRTLCYGEGDQKWRDYAGRMIELEISGDPTRRDQLVRAFNAGYFQEQARHNACGRAVAVDAAALAENGRHLAGMLGDPYRQR